MRAAPRSRRRPARRSARRRLGVTVGCTALLAALGTAGLFALDQQSPRTPTSGPTTQARAVPQLPDPTAAPSATAEQPGPQPSDAPPSSGGPSGTPSSGTSSSSAQPEIVAHGSGSFTSATANGDRVGTGGVVRRYRVEVENGIGIDPNGAAAAVQAVLSDPRSWTTDKRDSFQLVSSGSYDFTVKIASPDTADGICATGGLDTGGEVNCDVGKQVVVNSKRWLTGSPQFDGSLDDYRALIINHEVGHRIGHGHESCPGPGEPAPAMMQQIYGLKGCVANAWPYDSNGKYLSGPSAP
ncbi:DUF3152 domain-containing protein [Kitasatospora sp. NA04385]|uniref:DUF3152 domain-containing protein n=1 Tax=Kitasatospora sp. NA04385 TaxID=2742135 RepID=UPI00158FC1A1|nr:DUF3152 domain-containing protein [Kitasatospora sp. NA04385]QKW20703.1 DUF3152 domain-containing protein [Kitasatospora sp. NA04385]